MHGSNRLGGNSLSDLLVFGKRAGRGRGRLRRRARRERPKVSEDAVAEAAKLALAPFDAAQREAARTRTRCSTTCRTVDDRPGRHHPQARTSWTRRSSSWPSCGSGARTCSGDRRPAVQPGLAPGARPAQHAGGLRVHREGGAGAGGVAAAATPARTSRRWTRSGAGQPGLLGPTARRRGHQLDLTEDRCRRCGPDLLGLFEQRRAGEVLHRRRDCAEPPGKESD